MKNTIIILLFLQFGISQTDTTFLSYYPLHLGNYWEYKHSISDWNEPYFGTFYYSIEVINDTILSNGNTYQHLVKKSIPDTSYTRSIFERIDTLSGNVYRYHEESPNNEYLIDSLISQVGDTSQASRDYPDEIDGVITTCVAVYSDTVIGHFTTVKHFYYLNMNFIPGFNYYIGQDIGFIGDITSEAGVTVTNSLKYARINGIEYGTHVSIDNSGFIPSKFLLHQNYPNPFNSETVISYELYIESEITINLYNVNW